MKKVTNHVKKLFFASVCTGSHVPWDNEDMSILEIFQICEQVVICSIWFVDWISSPILYLFYKEIESQEKMKYLAAYLLLNASGATPSADKVKAVLESVGIEAEEDKVSALLSSLEGKSVDELIVEGNEKLAAVPAAGPATGSAGAAAGSSEGAAEEAAAEEEAEESDDDMGFGLFD